MSTHIQRLITDDPRMSQLVIRNGIVYMSGQTDKKNSEIEGQTKAVLAKIDQRLAAAGTNKSKLLTAQIWLKDIERDFKAMNKVWCEWVDPDNKPVRATVEASLASTELLVEIQVTAAME